MRRVSLAAALACVVAMMAPPAAWSAGAVITWDPGANTTTIVDDGQALDLVVLRHTGAGTCSDGNGLPVPCDAFTPLAGTIAAGNGCGIDSGNVVCPHVAAYIAQLNAGDDSLSFEQELVYTKATIFGGPGEEDLRGGSGVDEMHGGDDADKLRGNAGDDRLYGDDGADLAIFGGPGGDLIDGGAGDDDNLGRSGPGVSEPDPGADTIVGGTGVDRFSYEGITTSGVTVTLDGVGNDGPPGETDNVGTDVEAITGSPGDDRISGDDGPNTLGGNGGDDVLNGNGGDDALSGDGGGDTLNGGAGSDLLLGAIGDDRIDGGSGRDSVFGDDRTCTTGPLGQCFTGNDTITVADSEQDAVSCGPGADRVDADAVDVITTDTVMGCETITRPGKTDTADKPRPTLSFTGGLPVARIVRDRRGRRLVAITVRGRLVVPAGIDPTAGCRGRVVVTVTSRGRKVTARSAPVDARCRYRKVIRFSRSKVRGRRLAVTVFFAGNATLAGATLKETIALRG